MARLLGIHIKNYRVLADVSLGQVEYSKGTPLPRLTCLIGPNGSGKSTVLDAFGFVADCLIEGVEAACDKPARGGFDKIRTQGAVGPISFELFFEDDDPVRPIVYKFEVDLVGEIPKVVAESCRQRREGETLGKPYYFLKLERGKGKVWAGQSVGAPGQAKDSKKIALADLDKLGVATLGQLAEHPRVVALRSYIEQWYLSYFVPDAARTLPPAGAQRWLDRQGSNIGNVLQYYERQYPNEFAGLLDRLAASIPGLRKIATTRSADGRLLLAFDEQGYSDPFYQQSMSDGTLKMVAYALLLEDPRPRPFIGIEEPENGLYVRLVERLSGQFSSRAERATQKTQFLITTHSPYFVDSLRPEQVWIVRKDASGRAELLRTADQPNVQHLVEEGIPLGALWYSNHFGERVSA